MMNALKAVLDKVEAFNVKATAHKLAGDALDVEREDILSEAKELGLKHLKTSAMLAKVKTKLTMVSEGPAGDPDFAEV